MHPSTDQQLAIDTALSGQSFFLTGGGGTGKSFTLQKVIESISKKYSGRPGSLGIVAPTGVAAMQVGGTTIHSYFGLKLVTKEDTIKQWKRNAWTQLQVLVIDEISMVPDWMLNLLDRMGRESRFSQKHLPFGGVQLILCGDFLQLAPIKASYCFKSKAWKDTMNKCIELKFAYRQGSDPEFASILNRIRLGQVDQVLLDSFNRETLRVEGIEQTRLYSKKDSVDEENAEKLQILPGESHIFSARDSGGKWAFEAKKLSTWSNAPSKLSLKIGAQVVLLKNIDIEQGLVNGSRGIIVGFTKASAPVVRFLSGLTLPIEIAKWTLTKKDENHSIIATRYQYPLSLAWAITIHKSQGMSLDAVYTDLNECFADGMAYVALSRCKTLRGLTVIGLSAKSIRTNKEAIEFHAQIIGRQEEEERVEKRRKVEK
jgi:ATP-dependent DNA helicase PIF1